VDVDDNDPKVLISPAACHVVPDVSVCFSRSMTSSTPSLDRWYAMDVPMIPPPMIQTLVFVGSAGTEGVLVVFIVPLVALLENNFTWSNRCLKLCFDGVDNGVDDGDTMNIADGNTVDANL